MKTLEDLGNYYVNTLLPDLQDLEAERKGLQGSLKALVATLGAAAVGGTWWLCSFWRGPRDTSSLVGILFLFWGGLAAAAVFFFRVLTTGYAADFKGRIISKLVAFIDPSLDYNAGGCIDTGVLVGSGLFKHWPSSCEGQDYIAGTIGDTRLQFADVDACYETVDQKGNKHHPRLFKGLFIAADFNKKLHGMTFVFPDEAKGLLGDVLGRAVQSLESKDYVGGGYGELVTLEDPDFNRKFVVYSSDQIEARYVLTPTLMAHLVKYVEMSGETPWLSFVGNRVCVAVPKSDDPFAPRVFGPLVEFGQIVKYYGRIKAVVRIVDDLHLNTRIWSA